MPQDSFYQSTAWIEVRDRRLVFSMLKCEICGRGRAEGTQLHVHHIKSRYRFPNLALDINNLMTLCQWCHAFLHPHMRKNLPVANDPCFEERRRDGAMQLELSLDSS